MQDRASELPRMLILGTWVNKPPGGVPASTELFALAYMDREVPKYGPESTLCCANVEEVAALPSPPEQDESRLLHRPLPAVLETCLLL